MHADVIHGSYWSKSVVHKERMKQNQDHHITACCAGEHFLSKEDPVMARLIEQYGPCELEGSGHSLFHSLASAVIAQQLSVKAASTIQGRVMKLTSSPMVPKYFLATDPAEVRSAGLSKSKDAYIRNIARAIVDDGLSKRKLQRLDDSQVIHELTAIKGVGKWTAEMYAATLIGTRSRPGGGGDRDDDLALLSRETQVPARRATTGAKASRASPPTVT